MFLAIVLTATVFTKVTPTNPPENGCCPSKTVGQDLYTLTSHSDTTPHNCKDQCVYHKNGDTRSRFCFAPGNMEVGCNADGNQPNQPIKEILEMKKKLDELKSTLEKHIKGDQTQNPTTKDQGIPCGILEPQIHHQNRKYRENRTIAMLLEQSSFFRNLSTGPQQDAYINASRTNGFSMDNRCPLETLAKCNDDQDTINKCAADDLTAFVECLNKKSPNCACALTSLLGFDCYGLRMVRFIRSNSDGVFGNLLLTPYEDKKEDLIFETRLYMNYDGMLIPDTDEDTLTQNFENHKKYWEDKYGPIRSKRQAEEAEAAKTIIDTADTLVNVLDKTKNIVLAGLQKDISEIKTDIVGITAAAKKQIQDSLNLLYTSEVDIQRTRLHLESLAKETVTQVDEMVYYLDLVPEDWPDEKIAKFLRFESKKMAELVDRSLKHLEKADKLYPVVQKGLATIRGNLETFQTTVLNLLDVNSKAHKAAVEELRLIVYLTCCTVGVFLTGGIACAFCILGVEIKVAELNDALNTLEKTINLNVANTKRIHADVVDNGDRLSGEVGILIDWGAALTTLSRQNWTFPDDELFGFADVRPRIHIHLENLKIAANNYLEKNFRQPD